MKSFSHFVSTYKVELFQNYENYSPIYPIIYLFIPNHYLSIDRSSSDAWITG